MSSLTTSVDAGELDAPAHRQLVLASTAMKRAAKGGREDAIRKKAAGLEVLHKELQGVWLDAAATDVLQGNGQCIRRDNDFDTGHFSDF